MDKIRNAEYQDPNNSIEMRTEDLLNRMTVEEKVAQIGCVLAAMGRFSDMEQQLKNGIGQIGTLGGCFTIEKNVEVVQSVQEYLLENTRLGIPALFHIETLNGTQMAKGTVFPIPIGMGASWDDKTVGEVSAAIKKETMPSGYRLALAPVMDVARDPRWGRMGETYGENATLTSAMSASYVKGLQGDDLSDGVAAAAKHFVGYAMSEGGLNMAESHLTNRELREVYSKPFEASIRLSGLEGVMNAYQIIDGVPVAASREILTDLLRDELGFYGLTVSDYSSIEKSYDVFKVAEDVTHAGILAMNAGLDCELPNNLCYGDGFISAINSGKIDVEAVDEAVRRILRLKFKLGLFENPYPSASMLEMQLQCDEHLNIAYKMACKSIVMLKNKDNILPLSNKHKKIAVIGPNADNLRNLFSGYSYIATYEMMYGFMTRSAGGPGLEGVTISEEQIAQSAAIAKMMPTVDQAINMNFPNMQTVYQAICEDFPHAAVNYAKGCDISERDYSGFDEAVKLANDCDVAILVLGGKNGSGAGCTMGENVDASDIGLPGVQEELAKAVAATGKPFVIVHINGRPLSSEWVKDNASAILEAWHPGQCGAKAIADTIYGANNPAGKLPVTVPRNVGHIPIYADQKRGSGVSYRGVSNSSVTEGYFNESGFPLYPFGYGLSYTTFELSSLELSSNEIESDGSADVSCIIKNTGKVAGDEVIQLYFSDCVASVTRPVKELAGFIRVFLQPGEMKKVIFTFYADQTAFIGADMKWRVESGDIDLMIGNSSDCLNLKSALHINDTKILKSGKRSYFCDVKTD
jgi:beta-glucosidase